MSSSQRQVLTFAEAYRLRKRTEVSEIGSRRKDESATKISNISELYQLLEHLVKNIQDDEKSSFHRFKYVKHVLKDIPNQFNAHVTSWVDSNNLDLLHHAIINNIPDLVLFILADSKMFPFTHVPPTNPYAHLAAILGHIECLRYVIINRPGSFFKADRPSHAIKLPREIMIKTKLNQAVVISRSTEKILERIKSSTKCEEKKLQTVSAERGDSDITHLFNKELGAIEKSFTKKKQRLTRSAILHKPKPEGRKSGNIGKSDEENMKHDMSKKTAQVMWERKANLCPGIYNVHGTDSLRNHFKRRLPPIHGCNAKKHLITVFWDALSDIDVGVIAGAGVPVAMKKSPMANRFRNIDLDRDDFYCPISERRESNQKPVSNHRRTSLRPKGITSSHLKDMSPSAKKLFKTIEPGVRGKKKYKDFQLEFMPKSEGKDDSETYMNKTPLTYAAERGHIDCVKMLLETVVLKRNPNTQSREPLTLSTKARSPEAIILLMDNKPSRSDIQSAVLSAIREMYPDCLTALLINKMKDRINLLEPTNLFHTLFSQSVQSSNRYELLPEMTKALIKCKEDVNSKSTPRTYPMYTLINCAFNIIVGKQIFFFIECLNILLENKANPHYDEEKQCQKQGHDIMFTRQPFSSAINCVFESAKTSMNYFESTFWPNMFAKKFVTTIEMNDRTPRRVLNYILFNYMDVVCVLGLDKTIIRCLLRYGANPDFKKDGKYAINVYFDHLFPYLTRFEVIGSYDRYLEELLSLKIICKCMSFDCLSDALLIFLKEHLLTAPLQALPISRQFASMMDELIKTPRPLGELAAHAIWCRVKRNKKKVKELPISDEVMPLIIP